MAGAVVMFKTTPQIPNSTIEREALDKSKVTVTEYYDDRLNWLTSGKKVENGMKYFFDKTGVQPYLLIADNIDGSINPSPSQTDKYLDDLYNQMFKDEQHMIILYFDNGSSWFTRYYCGGYFSFEKSGHPYIEVKASYPEAVVHEVGHFVDAICKYRFNSIRFIIAFYIERWQYVIRNYIFDPGLFNSFYYQRRQEWFAESFKTNILWSSNISLDCIKRTNNIIINCINEINDKHRDH